MTNRSKLNRWIELNNDNIYKSLRGPAYFKVHNILLLIEVNKSILLFIDVNNFLN
jgi:hypothetical protein